jgi:hypothetical protein
MMRAFKLIYNLIDGEGVVHFWKNDTALKLHALDNTQTFKSFFS